MQKRQELIEVIVWTFNMVYCFQCAVVWLERSGTGLILSKRSKGIKVSYGQW